MRFEACNTPGSFIQTHHKHLDDAVVEFSIYKVVSVIDHPSLFVTTWWDMPWVSNRNENSAAARSEALS